MDLDKKQIASSGIMLSMSLIIEALKLWDIHISAEFIAALNTPLLASMLRLKGVMDK